MEDLLGVSEGATQAVGYLDASFYLSYPDPDVEEPAIGLRMRKTEILFDLRGGYAGVLRWFEHC